MIIEAFHRIIWQLPFFSDLNCSEKQNLLSTASFKHMQKGEYAFLQGDPLTSLYWVCHGAIQLFRITPNGHELTSAICIAGDMLFDPDLLHFDRDFLHLRKHKHATNARAVNDAALLTIPVIWVEENLKSFDMLADKFLAVLTHQLREAQMDVEHRSTMNSVQLLACFLQQLCVLHDFDPDGFELPYTKSLIASRLGIDLATLSRALCRLKEHGIAVEGDHVSFKDLGKIKQFVCNFCSANEECHTRRILDKRMHDTSLEKI